MTRIDIPTALLLGVTEGEWPIHVFTEDSHAIYWLEQDSGRRRVWAATVEIGHEMRVVRAEPRLEPKRPEPGGTP